MSFSSDVKSAVAHVPRHDDESLAMLYGMVIFAHTFSEDEISLRTETAEVSDVFCGLLLGELDIMISPEMYKKKDNIIYKITIENKDDIAKIRKRFSAESIDRTLLVSEHANTAFLKGAFLSCGYINAPDKPYRLDFTVEEADTAVELATMIFDQIGSMPKLSVRKNAQIVYFRESNLIVDFLNLIGATSAAFTVMNSQIERDIRNNLNRKNNFDIANIEKRTEAGLAQTEAIKWLMECGKFDDLPISLKSTARIRMGNPYAPLDFIGSACDPPISKSQVSKRLKQIVEIYKNEKEK